MAGGLQGAGAVKYNLGLAYSSRNEIDNTQATFEAWRASKHSSTYDFHWIDGSSDADAVRFLNARGAQASAVHRNIHGGADAVLVYKLTLLLQHPKKYTHIGLLENDVMLDPDWFEPTMELFEKGKRDGLEVGAVSPRSYVDRVLIQRDGYAVMHNLGAGVVVFTREAAKLVLAHFRTGYWQDNVRLFAAISGIDLRTYAAFGTNEQWVTTDWIWDAVLARHGLASLALTPAKCQMIGQKIPLEQQGLILTTEGNIERAASDEVFELYRTHTYGLRWGDLAFEYPGELHRDGAGILFFPHQLGLLAGGAEWKGTLELQWSQGFGPFAYRASNGASISLRVSGVCSFLITGGRNGARVTINDTRSGFKTEPKLPSDESGIVTVSVPGTPVPRMVTLFMEQGAVFHGLHCVDPQMLNAAFKFEWSQLPETA
jgi:hypothetical protein